MRQKYTDEHILCEAGLYLHGYSMSNIAKILKTPLSTVSWHLIFPLKRINYQYWIDIRESLLKNAKNHERASEEEREIQAFKIIYIQEES